MSALLPLPVCNPASLMRNNPSFTTKNFPRSCTRNCFTGTGLGVPAGTASNAAQLSFGGDARTVLQRAAPPARYCSRAEAAPYPQRSRPAAAQSRVCEGGKLRDNKQLPTTPPRPGPASHLPQSSRTGRCRRQRPDASIPARMGPRRTEPT